MLERALNQIVQSLRKNQKFFLFLNLYDVHWPYPTSNTSVLSSWRSARGCVENLTFPFVLPKIGAHAYLSDDFRISNWSRSMLMRRYHQAIALADARLAAFWTSLRDTGAFDNTLIIMTSDHGEAFGEHRLYMHDASVWDVHLRVPLWIHYPGLSHAKVDQVVSTRDLFGVMRSALSRQMARTILSEDYRGEHPLAFAEHYFYPHAKRAAPRFRHNLGAIIGHDAKLILNGEAIEEYDLSSDPAEATGFSSSLEEFANRFTSNSLKSAILLQAQMQRSKWRDTAAALL